MDIEFLINTEERPTFGNELKIAVTVINKRDKVIRMDVSNFNQRLNDYYNSILIIIFSHNNCTAVTATSKNS